MTGTLAIHEGGRSELSINDRLRPYEPGDPSTRSSRVAEALSASDVERDGVYRRIFGQVQGEPITLDDCFMIRRTGGLAGSVVSERILAQRVYRGIRLHEAEPSFNSITVDILGMPEWLGMTGLSGDWTGESERPRCAIEVRAEALQTITATDGTGARFSIRQQPNLTGDGITSLGVRQDFYLTFQRRSRTPLDDLLGRIGDVQNLVAIATNTPPAIGTVRLSRSDHLDTFKGKRHPKPVELIAVWQIKAPTAPARIQPTFTLMDLGGARGLGKWLRMSAAHRSHISRAVSSRHSPSLWVSDGLLNATASLEGFGRALHGKAKLHRHLEQLSGHAGAPFQQLVGDTGKWARAVTLERNALAHHNSGVLASGERQLYLARSAYYLAVLCALRSADAPASVLEKVTASSDFTWLRDRLLRV